MNGRLLARGLVGGVGVAFLAGGLGAMPSVAGWSGVLVGGQLLFAAVLARLWPEVWRFVAAMLVASGLLWFRHLKYDVLLALPPAVTAPFIVAAVLCCVVTFKSLRGILSGLPPFRRDGGEAGPVNASRCLLVLLLGLYGTARWFTPREWQARPDDVFRGLYPLVVCPLGLLALVAAARQIPFWWLAAAEAWWRSRLLRAERSTILCIALGTVLVTAVLCHRCVGPLPHIEDGIAYLYQAKTFLTGGFKQPAPAVPGAFDATFAWVCSDDGHGWSYGIFPPGWPLVLALGVWCGLPWLVNPLLCGLAVWLFWRLVRTTDGRSVAGAAALLLALSPFAVIQGTSFLAHPAALVWILVALGATARLARRGSWLDALLLGLGVGLTLATRYVEGALLGVAVGGWLVVRTVRREVAVGWWLVGLLGLLPGLGLVLADNYATTGSLRETPVEQWYTERVGAPVNRPGFGLRVGLEWDHSLGPGHSLLEGLWNINANLSELNRYALGWAAGSFWFLAAYFLLGPVHGFDRLWWGYGLLLLAIYTAYWYHGIAFGPRFLHPLLLPLVLGTVKGAGRLAHAFGAARQRVRLRLLGVAICGVLTAWLAFTPYELLTSYHNARGRDASLRSVVRSARELAGGRPCLVIEAQRQLPNGAIWPDYGVGFSLNPVGFRGDVLVARELDPAGRSNLAALRAAYPERVLLVWYIEDGGASRLRPWGDGDGWAEQRENADEQH